MISKTLLQDQIDEITDREESEQLAFAIEEYIQIFKAGTNGSKDVFDRAEKSKSSISHKLFSYPIVRIEESSTKTQRLEPSTDVLTLKSL